MPSHIPLYAATLAIFLALDIAWLKTVAGPMFRRQVGALMLEEPRLGVAAAFYAFYCIGIVYFAVAPAVGDAGSAFRDGLLFGLFAYGAYESTNLATLKGWTWRMAAIDTCWGGVVTGLSAAGAVMLAG